MANPLKRFQEKGGTGMVTIRIELLMYNREGQRIKV